MSFISLVDCLLPWVCTSSSSSSSWVSWDGRRVLPHLDLDSIVLSVLVVRYVRQHVRHRDSDQQFFLLLPNVRVCLSLHFFLIFGNPIKSWVAKLWSVLLFYDLSSMTSVVDILIIGLELVHCLLLDLREFFCLYQFVYCHLLLLSILLLVSFVQSYDQKCFSISFSLRAGRTVSFARVVTLTRDILSASFSVSLTAVSKLTLSCLSFFHPSRMSCLLYFICIHSNGSMNRYRSLLSFCFRLDFAL